PIAGPTLGTAPPKLGKPQGPNGPGVRRVWCRRPPQGASLRTSGRRSITTAARALCSEIVSVVLPPKNDSRERWLTRGEAAASALLGLSDAPIIAQPLAVGLGHAAEIRRGHGLVGRSARPQPARPGRLPVGAACPRHRSVPASAGARHHYAGR